MLKILGDINEIKKPSIHNEAMICLHNIWSQLTDVSGSFVVIHVLIYACYIESPTGCLTYILLGQLLQ